MNIDPIVNKIENLFQSSKGSIWIGIDGRSGSGKSTISQIISEKLKNVTVVHLDKFDLYESENVSKVIDEVIQPLKSKKEKSIIILEGVFALNSKLVSFYNYKIWIEFPKDLGFERGLKRDINLNDIDNSNKWITYWLPKEDEYINKEKPYQKADYIIDGSK